MWNDLKSYIQALASTLAKSDEGQTLVEYALIIALVSVALVAGLGLLAGGIGAGINSIIASL
jgi:Flp pilus assembly pilin Flp